MKVVITCAGMGKRLLPLTKDKPKCLVEINGKPIIQYTIDNLIGIGLKDIILIVGYKGDQIKDYFKDYNLTYIEQTEINGTANAVLLSKEHIDSDFIVLAGDTIYSRDSLLTLSYSTYGIMFVDKEEDEVDKKKFEYGTLLLNEDNEVVTIAEKTEPVSRLVNCNGYLLPKEIFGYIEKAPMNDKYNEKIITEVINSLIIDGFKFHGLVINSLDEVSRVEDIKKLEDKLNGNNKQ